MNKGRPEFCTCSSTLPSQAIWREVQTRRKHLHVERNFPNTPVENHWNVWSSTAPQRKVRGVRERITFPQKVKRTKHQFHFWQLVQTCNHANYRTCKNLKPKSQKKRSEITSVNMLNYMCSSKERFEPASVHNYHYLYTLHIDEYILYF